MTQTPTNQQDSSSAMATLDSRASDHASDAAADSAALSGHSPTEPRPVGRRLVAGAGLASIGLLAACRPVSSGSSASPSPSLSATPTPTPTASATPTPSPTPSATATATGATATATAPATGATATGAPATGTPGATAPGAVAPPPATDGVTPDAALLARRASYGPTGPLLADLEATGVLAWLDAQLDPASVPDPLGDQIDAAFPDLTRSAAELRERLNGPGGLRSKIQGHHLLRGVYSSRQLYEVLVDFFANHLNINVRGDGQQMWTRADYQMTVIRPHALGRFEDMLHASGLHPSMLDYLDNESSRAGAINENYARELLELHTVGVDGGYTEEEIPALARLLTGWRARRDEGWVTRFDPDRHAVGPETILGRTFANDSADAGPVVWDEVVAFLSRHPATAQYLSRKLARHFVADEPPQALVDRLAQVYLDNDTAIAPVVRALLTSGEFAASAGQKTRRPYERYLATLRLVSSELPSDLEEAGEQLVRRLVAHQPLAWAPPDGYPDVAVEWESPGDALDLFNKSAELLRGRPDVVPIDVLDRILAAGPTDFAAVVDAAAQVLLLRPPSEAELAGGTQLLGSGSLSEPLAAGSGAQRRAAEVAGTLLLTSPAHLQR